MDRIFADVYVRRNFFIAFGALLLAYAIFRAYFGQRLSMGMAIELADKFAMSLSVTVALAAFLFYVTPRLLERQPEIVSPQNLRSLFKAQIELSRTWTFYGATGRYVRSQVIPRFQERAAQQRQPLSVMLILLDVSNANACEKYADYRNGTEPRDKQWTAARVRQEVCATVITAMAFRTALLRIDIKFIPTFSALRADISDDKVILTKEDPGSSALVCDRRSRYYDYFALDARVAESQARHPVQPQNTLDLPAATVETAREMLRDTNLLRADETGEFLAGVLAIARERRNPYPG